MTSARRLRFLLLEDDAMDAELIAEALAAAAIDCDIEYARDGNAFMRVLAERFDLIMADFSVPGLGGMQALALAIECAPGVPFVFVSGAIGEEQAIELIRQGATDYVLKTRLSRLGPAVQRALDEASERRRRQRAEAALFELASVGLGHLSADGQWLRANARLAEMLGLPTPDVLVGRRFLDGIDEGDHPYGAKMLQALVNGRGGEAELRCARPDQKPMWAHVTMWASSGDAGQERYFTAVYIDATARKRQEQRLWEVQTQMGIAAKIAGLGFWEWNPATSYLHWSSDWISLLGYGIDDLAEEFTTWEKLLHPDDRERALAWLAGMAASEPRPDRPLEFRLRASDSTYRWVVGRGLAVAEMDGRASYFVGSYLDITARKAFEERISQLAHHDELTGLPNRRLVFSFGEHLLAAARRDTSQVGLLFIDLDRFKEINDTYGHDVGDAVLQEVARRLMRCVRSQDLVGRLGGDEFVVVLPDIHASEDAAVVAYHALRCFEEPCRVGERLLEVLPSIGIALFPGDGDGMDGLIKSADAAMFEAKNSGGNAFRFFKPTFNARMDASIKLEDRLRAALKENEFELHYQPVIDTQSGAVNAVEALLRWPASGVGPEQFIPVAEAAGHLHKIGLWVLNEVCRQQIEWRAHGLPAFPVSINVSPSQFREKTFVQNILDIIGQNQLAGDDLRLELAEGAVMGNLERTANVLDKLREAGVKVALDDVGTGYSNLGILSRLPIDIVKIDRSFIRDLIQNPAHLAVAEAIIALARSLDLDLIAEGVESQEMADFLSERQCRHSQGFHFCPPIPGREFETWYRSHAT